MSAPGDPTPNYQLSDMPREGWVDRYLPPFLRPYARLARFDRLTPIWLLLLPCWWAIALAAAPGGIPNIWLLFLFGLGSIVMRGAGCTFNDLVDRAANPAAIATPAQLDALATLAGKLINLAAQNAGDAVVSGHVRPLVGLDRGGQAEQGLQDALLV